MKVIVFLIHLNCMIHEVRRYDERHLHYEYGMERFLGLGKDTGVHTYVIRGTDNVQVDRLIWIGYFPNGFAKGIPLVTSGGLEGRPAYAHVRTLLETLTLPRFPKEVDFLLEFGEESRQINTESTEDIPSVGIINGKDAKQEEIILLRTLTQITPQEALRLIKRGFFRAYIG